MINFLINSIMMPLLVMFHDLTGSYGWAIVFLTLAVKTALLPLTYQSIKSSLDMQRLQPQLKEIQQKYKDKPEILNKKMMEFYRDNRFNPLSGCLPILVQLPIFIALYSTFISQQFKDMAHTNPNGASFLFITDLAQSTIYEKATGVLHYDNILLIILFAVTMFLSQKMMVTNSNDPMQKQMLYMMPIMIPVMFLFVPVPSGALLYMVVSNLVGIGQNVFVLNKKKSLNLEMEKAKSGNSSVADKVIKEIEQSKNINLDKNSVKKVKMRNFLQFLFLPVSQREQRKS
ncbi:MAG: YidC/Oxa1 family membrane protein insertase [Candidatus Sericytochromatia bacterium]